MPGHDILIIYGTSYGQTAKIARFMADQLRETGARATLVDVDEIPRDLDLAAYDGVLVGGSVLYGRHKKALRRFVQSHREALARVPSGFFSLSGSAASANAADRARASAFIDDFARRTGWRPSLTVSLAGAMAYTRYHPLMRWMLRRIARNEGRPTDTSRDHEMTDWAEVRRFVDAFDALLPAPALV